MGICSFLSDMIALLVVIGHCWVVIRGVKSVCIDIINKSSRNTIQTMFFTLASVAGWKIGYPAGISIGHEIDPTSGMTGGLTCGLILAAGLGKAADLVSEALFEAYDYNVDAHNCQKCLNHFYHRRFEQGIQVVCPICKTEK